MAEPQLPADEGQTMPVATKSRALRLVEGAGAIALTLLGLFWVLELAPMLGIELYEEQLRAVALGIGFALVFLHKPADRGVRTTLPWYDALLAALGLAVMLHVAISYDRLLIVVTQRTPEVIAIGAIIVALVLEGLRRATGLPLLIVALCFIGYALMADLVPGDLQGRPIELDKLLIYLALDTNALLGTPMQVGPTIVLMFILFGQVLFAAGGGQFFTDLAMACVGRSRGGSAKIAVVASGLFGSISGTAVSNVASTGVVTIPLMRRSGYDAVTAGAIEAVASTGGQLMPPVMGTSAFLMAEILAIPYTDVVIAAAIPAFLYYIAIFFHVDLIAARDRIRVIDTSMPSFRAVLGEGWHFLIPFAVLLYSLFYRMDDPETGAVYATATTIVVGALRGYGGRQLTPRHLLSGVIDTGLIMIDLFMILAVAGFVIGILNVSGLGFALTLFLLHLGGHQLSLLLLISAAVCIVLGMGMPTIGVYILLATLVAPAIAQAGASPISAHMFIFYFGMMSMITPPIAMAAFTAATISRADPMRTGWASMKLGWVAYLIPFLFVYSPTLLMRGNPILIVFAFATALIGVFYVTVAVAGYFTRPLGAAPRVALAIAGVAAIVPATGPFGDVIDAAGIVVGAAVLAVDRLAARRSSAARS